jgi:hypothetical protein
VEKKWKRYLIHYVKLYRKSSIFTTIGEHGRALSAERKMGCIWVLNEENALSAGAVLTAEGFLLSKEGPCSI